MIRDLQNVIFIKFMIWQGGRKTIQKDQLICLTKLLTKLLKEYNNLSEYEKY